jgi:hypothetical protein
VRVRSGARSSAAERIPIQRQAEEEEEEEGIK